jgi:hypothetical protein
MAKERPVDPGCKDPADPESCLVTSPGPFRRLADPCGDVVLPDPCVIDPTLFKAAEALPDVSVVPTPSLLAVELTNQVYSLSCLAPFTGGSGITKPAITVDAGTLTRGVPLSQIPDLTETQRLSLAGMLQSAVNALANQTDLEIATNTGLTLAQATVLKESIDAEVIAIQDQVEVVAEAALDCYYINTEQIVVCAKDPEGVDANYGTTTIIVPADTVRSPVSVLAADAEARVLGQLQLDCRWLNQIQTSSCASSGAVVGTFVVAADTFYSTTSRADANAMAKQVADSELDCRYPNTQVTVACAAGAVVSPGTNPITILAGEIFSSVSVADAVVQATAAAQAQLRCEWRSAEVTVTCPPDEGHAASATASPVYSVTVAAGTFASFIDQADANDQATLYATGQLGCRYCNTEVEALCATGGSIDQTEAVAAGTFCESTFSAAQEMATTLAAIPIQIKVSGSPICHYTNDRRVAVCVQPNPNPNSYLYKFTTSAGVGLSSGSSGAITVDAGAITSTVSKADANTQAELLALASLNCFFASTLKRFECADDADSVPVSANATQPFDVAAGQFISYTSQLEANSFRDTYGNSLLDCFWESDLKLFECADDADSVPVSANATQPFNVIAGQFTSYTSKAEANSFRDAYGNSILDCFWESTLKRFECADDANSEPVSTNATQPFNVAAGQFTSYTSRAEANAVRDTYGSSLLECFWESDLKRFECADDGDSEPVSANATQPFNVIAGQFTSYTSKVEANSFRDTYGNSLLDCFWESGPVYDVACTADAAVGSYPASSSPVDLPPGLFTSYTSLAEADALRDVYASSIKSCFWKNAPQTKWCDNTESTTAIAPNNYTVPADTVVSLQSKAEANSLASALATASLLCVYANVLKNGGTCAAGTTKLQTGTVSAGTIRASSQAAADTLAQTLANALNVCASDSILATAVTPGSQGPAGNCSNPCGAFYS